jgi:hypothetical protein
MIKGLMGYGHAVLYGKRNSPGRFCWRKKERRKEE